MRRSGWCRVTGCSVSGPGTGRAWPPRAIPCCTSPSGTCRCGPIRCSSRRTRSGRSTSVTSRWNSGRSATRRTRPRSTIRPRRSDGHTASRPRSRSMSSGTRPARRYAIDDGYAQRGVAHGAIDVAGRDRIELVEVAAERWHRWTTSPGGLAPVVLPTVVAHTNVRAPFAFPDGSTTDLVLTPDGWRERDPRRR